MRVVLNGFGRIGRAICRINQRAPRFEIVAVNDINPDIDNMAYLIKYDSTYGRLDEPVSVEGRQIAVNGHRMTAFHESSVLRLPWDDLQADVLIDASGVHDNVVAAPEVLRRGVKKVVITHSPDQVDHTVVFGANEDTYRPADHHVISSSICDAVAVAPVLKMIHGRFGLDSGFLTTLHPWLAYQNLLDGPSVSWAAPGTIYAHYAIGRASPGSLIPKPTSAVDATIAVLPELRGALQCMSFRVPVQTVGAANLYLNLNRSAAVEEVHALFEECEAAQQWPVIHNNREPLVSVDFAATNYSAVIDQRWTTVTGGRHLYLVLWYDNEWGYSSRVVDLVAFLGEAGWGTRAGAEAPRS